VCMTKSPDLYGCALPAGLVSQISHESRRDPACRMPRVDGNFVGGRAVMSQYDDFTVWFWCWNVCKLIIQPR
jgi:hypothetical protein